MGVSVVGAGHSIFGKRNDVNVQELAFESFSAALQDANITQNDVDALFIGTSPEYHKQRSLAGVVAEYLGMNPKPTYLMEAACASGSAAFRTGYAHVRAGMHRTVAVLGLQKMSELPTPDILALMGRVGDVQWESVYGTTFPGYYALYARRHMHEFGTTEEQMGLVAVKNHRNALLNPNAMFRKEVTLEKVLGSRPVATPLKVYDACANADGSACLIITGDENARRFTDTPVRVAGIGCASSEMSVLRRGDLTSIPSTALAAREAFEMADVKPADVDVAEVHDCFTIAEILAYEDLGFCEKGRGGRFIQEGLAERDGQVAVNIDGGLKAKGHPVGATGVSMMVEVVKQLRGEAGRRQVADAGVGLTHNVGGIGQYTFVHLFGRG